MGRIPAPSVESLLRDTVWDMDHPSTNPDPRSEVLAIINAIVLTVLFSAFWIWCAIQIVIAIF